MSRCLLVSVLEYSQSDTPRSERADASDEVVPVYYAAFVFHTVVQQHKALSLLYCTFPEMMVKFGQYSCDKERLFPVSFSYIYILQGSVATQSRCGRI